MKNSEEGSYNERFITKLRRNFRSHELILELPNRLFYDGELIVSILKKLRLVLFPTEVSLSFFWEHFFYVETVYIQKVFSMQVSVINM
jgi:hypothetical protein